METNQKLICFYRHGGIINDPVGTLMFPSGSLAAVSAAAQHAGLEHVVVDENYVGNNDFEDVIRQQIEDALAQRQRPVVFGSIFHFNAGPTIDFLSLLKREYGERIKTGVGGQATRMFAAEYALVPEIDVVGKGDAETILSAMVQGSARIVVGPPQVRKTTSFSYDHYFLIKERLDLGESIRSEGLRKEGLEGIRQLAIERTRECGWAAGNSKGACLFCSLPDVTEAPAMDIDRYIRLENRLARDHRLSWVYDVSNQWLPFRRTEAMRFLRSYVERRGGAPSSWKKYIYLSSYNIDDEMSDLLFQAGVGAAFIGIDHFDPSVLARMNKSEKDPERIFKGLASLKERRIKMKIGTVLGVYETPESVIHMRQGIERVCRDFGDAVLSVNCYTIGVYPGSKAYQQLLSSPGDGEVRRVLEKLERQGHISFRDEQPLLDGAYISLTSEFTYADIQHLREEIMAIPPAYGLVSANIHEKRKGGST